ncbi:uncharacterized protein LOC135955801 [Calliphora vicina]|uniref:uncharacterized protein LOC135955801 n=1 Tax=Calliphora vicina TaxID=7373 RepID=UPI00325BECCA
MSELENANSLYEKSVKLCAAVEKHKCLHDRNALRKNHTLECQIAWQLVAKECNQTIEYCKNRWKNLITSFYQGIKRKGNRYYLHEYMDFLLEGEANKTKTKRKPEATLNDETNSTTNEESMQGSLMETINLEDGEDSDSNTTSADESNELSNTDKGSQTAVGVFIIDEIAEEVEETENRDRRSSYKRSCKRGLNSELIDELDEEGEPHEPEGKRVRKLATDNRKKLTEQQTENKQLQIRLDKIKVKPAAIAIKNKDNKDPNEMEDMWSKKLNEAVNSSDWFYNQTKSSSPKPTKMVERSTSTNIDTSNMATQYEVLINPSDYDEIFMETIRNQLKQMNARQKMNFKCKIYHSLLEVFDDTTDFPGPNEVMKLPAKSTPRVVNTTTGELRLMRELVSLVQAAKNTPEIINAKEKVKISSANPSQPTPTPVPTIPVKLPVAGNDISKVATTSPLSLSPTLDDDDLQFSLDTLDVDDDVDAELPRTLDEIKAKPATESVKNLSEDNVMGLPKRILQKVVRVSGASGSTIVARDGDKKRIYRIYPKTINQNGLPTVANKNANIGTFYVSPAKGPSDVTISSGSHKIPNNLSNITIRPFNSMATINAKESPAGGNNSPHNVNTNVANKALANQSMFKNVNPSNRILSSSTGFFKMLPTTKNIAPATSNSNKSTIVQTQPANTNPTNFNKLSAAAKNTMLPPSTNFSTKRPMNVRAHINAPHVVQRRYSISGPLPAENRNSTLAPPQSSVATKNSTAGNTQLQASTCSTVQQIQISQPISLKNKGATTTTPNHSQQNITTSVNTTNEEDIKPAMKTFDERKQPNSKTSAKEAPKDKPMQPEEIPILETAGTVGVDVLDPLLVKLPQIKSEPADD